MPAAVDCAELEELVRTGAQLVEVLPEREYIDEHLPGAINIPLKHLTARAARRLDPGRPVVVLRRDEAEARLP